MDRQLVSLPGTAAEADKAFVADIYDAFNARQIDRLLDLMTPDVAWPNGMEGGYEHGREAVRAYWTRQWGMIDPQVTPQHVDTEPERGLAVRVRQVVRDLAGAVLRESDVDHVYTRREGLIATMEIRPVQGG